MHYPWVLSKKRSKAGEARLTKAVGSDSLEARVTVAQSESNPPEYFVTGFTLFLLMDNGYCVVRARDWDDFLSQYEVSVMNAVAPLQKRFESESEAAMDFAKNLALSPSDVYGA